MNKNLLGILAIVLGLGVIWLAAATDPSQLKVAQVVGIPDVVAGVAALVVRG